MPSPSWLRTSLTIVLTVAVVGGGGLVLLRVAFPQYYADTTVYSVDYDRPLGWKEVPPGPFTLFVYRHPDGKGTMRAAINEVQEDFNPTPELDTEGIANHYIAITDNNMPEWKAEKLDAVDTDREHFSLIRRTKVGKTVYTAFCSKGNTTLVVSLYAGGKDAESLDDLLPEFRKLLGSFRLTPKALEPEE